MYMTTSTIRSVRSTARFHSITIATSVPTNGTTTPARFAVRSTRVTRTEFLMYNRAFLAGLRGPWRPEFRRYERFLGPNTSRRGSGTGDRRLIASPTSSRGWSLASRPIELVALVVGQTAAPAAPDAHEDDEAPALGRTEPDRGGRGPAGPARPRTSSLTTGMRRSPGTRSEALPRVMLNRPEGTCSSLGTRPPADDLAPCDRYTPNERITPSQQEHDHLRRRRRDRVRRRPGVRPPGSAAVPRRAHARAAASASPIR